MSPLVGAVQWLPLVAVLGCGPSLEDPSSSSTGPATSSSGSTAATGTVGASSMTTLPDPSASTSASADAADGTSTTGTTGPTPGLDCDRPPPAVEPPVPDGCEPVWLVDAEGNAIVGAPSGLVRCAQDEWLWVVYRTAPVACPELIGDECLCDADCRAGAACICANEATTSPGIGQDARNRCLPSDCASADDCGGSMCRVDIGICLGAWLPEAIRCTTAADDCTWDSDCNQGMGRFCDYDEQMELFTCEPGAICE